ncbi:TolC family protein [Chitinophaga sp. Hz27]|uniref:TolC family protein n=1 Tax=Chitinophaga sp. Hz27 TaxID=3347169 RepID=UPI0035E23B19
MRILIILTLLPFMAAAQTNDKWTMQQAVQAALSNNKGLQAAGAKVKYFQELLPTSGEIGKTEVSMQYGQYNSYIKSDNNFSISQSIPFPTTFAAKKELGKSQVAAATFLKANNANELAFQVKEAWMQLLFLKDQRTLLQQQDSLFGTFAGSADLRYKTGESKMLEKTAADTRKQEVVNLLRQNQADITINQSRLRALLALPETEALPLPAESSISAVHLQPLNDTSVVSAHPYLQYLRQEVTTAQKQRQVYNAAILPDITVGYFNQSLIGTPVNASGTTLATGGDRFQGFQVGLALPLWARPLKAKAKAEKQQENVAALTLEQNSIQFRSLYQQALQQYAKQLDNLHYYESTALPNAALILKQSSLAYGAGEIGYAEHFLNMEQVLGIRQGYLKSLLDNQLAASYIDYLAGRQ